MPRHFFIQTVGCQMNVLDSELVAAELLRAGYEQVDAIGRADIDPAEHVQRPPTCRRQNLQPAGPAEGSSSNSGRN